MAQDRTSDAFTEEIKLVAVVVTDYDISISPIEAEYFWWIVLHEFDHANQLGATRNIGPLGWSRMWVV